MGLAILTCYARKVSTPLKFFFIFRHYKLFFYKLYKFKDSFDFALNVVSSLCKAVASLDLALASLALAIAKG